MSRDDLLEIDQLARQEWITRFVNSGVYRTNLDRSVVVEAARRAWPQMLTADPHHSAQEWASTTQW